MMPKFQFLLTDSNDIFCRNTKVDRYCIVMTSSQPYQLASEMSINYHGYYPEQLAEMMAKVAYPDITDSTLEY